ncbi:MAG: hypothetical protein V4640_01585 [Verrucomicrobiota bacterium]
MARRKRLATAVLHLVLAAAASAGEFIRVDEDATAARLQTAVTRYEKGDQNVELVGAVHIADKAYYQALTTRFTGYDALLFEMIGGEKFANHQAPAAEEDAKDLSGLHKVYAMVATFLNLTGQTEHIDYTTQNFVHADLTQAEFIQMQADRKESLIGFAMKAGKIDPDAPNQPDPAKLLRAMLSGSSNLVKLEIVHTLGRGDDQIAAFAGESVIITDRNQRCIDVMEKEFADGHNKLGIFYGAAHFPDLEKRLLERGFKRTQQDWLTAWDIPKAAAKPAEEPPANELKKAS